MSRRTTAKPGPAPRDPAAPLARLRAAIAAVPGTAPTLAALDASPGTFVEALTHASYAHQQARPSNQRLELLGDAVVNLVAATLVFETFAVADEGVLTRAKWALVRTEALAKLGGSLGLAAALMTGVGAPESLASQEVVLADAFEAVVGAAYKAGGLAAAEALVRPLLREVLASSSATVAADDPKTRLQIRVQAATGRTPTYVVANAHGPDHARTFVVEAVLDGRVLGRGEGPSKKQAAQAAATAALEAWPSDAAPGPAPAGVVGSVVPRVESAARPAGKASDTAPEAPAKPPRKVPHA